MKLDIFIKGYCENNFGKGHYIALIKQFNKCFFKLFKCTTAHKAELQGAVDIIHWLERELDVAQLEEVDIYLYSDICVKAIYKQKTLPQSFKENLSEIQTWLLKTNYYIANLEHIYLDNMEATVIKRICEGDCEVSYCTINNIICAYGNNKRYCVSEPEPQLRVLVDYKGKTYIYDLEENYK